MLSELFGTIHSNVMCRLGEFDLADLSSPPGSSSHNTLYKKSRRHLTFPLKYSYSMDVTNRTFLSMFYCLQEVNSFAKDHTTLYLYHWPDCTLAVHVCFIQQSLDFLIIQLLSKILKDGQHKVEWVDFALFRNIWSARPWSATGFIIIVKGHI